MKKLFVVIFMCLSLSVPRTQASGIPTVDILAFIQELLGYVQQLEEYSEMLNQTGLSLDQYTQIVEQYEQTLTEYEHALNQMQGLKDMLSDADYLELLNLIEVEFKNNPQGIDFDIAVFDESGYHDVDEAVGNVYRRTKDLGAMMGDISSTGAMGNSKTLLDKQTNQSYMQSKMITSQMYDVERIGLALDEMKADAVAVEFQRQSLATEDESDLATLQFIAWQQSVLINNVQKQQEIALAQLSYANQFDADVFSKQAKAVESQNNRLKEAAAKGEYIPENRGYTVDF